MILRNARCNDEIHFFTSLITFQPLLFETLDFLHTSNSLHFTLHDNFLTFPLYIPDFPALHFTDNFSSTATMVARTHLNVTLYVLCLVLYSIHCPICQNIRKFMLDRVQKLKNAKYHAPRHNPVEEYLGHTL